MTHTHNPAKHAAALLAAAALIFCLLVAPAAAFSGAGSGTEANPYIITTPAQLQEMNNAKGAYYRLANDIDLSGVTWTPIGTTTSGFYGELDGDGHTIKNLALSRTDQSAGLFRTLGSGATIKDLTLQDCTVTVTSNKAWCGVLVGRILMSSSAHETATISNVDCVRCSASSSGQSVANLVGTVHTAAVVEIIDCDISASSAISTSNYNVGNLIGMCAYDSSTQITRCTVANSYVKSPKTAVGNLIGACVLSCSVSAENCDVINCIAESTSDSYVANFVGLLGGGSSVTAENCDVINCIAKGVNYVGGLVGAVDIDADANVGSTAAATNCNINDCTIVATSNYAGGITGRVFTLSTGIFSGCTVSGCTILANTYAAGVCPAYS